MVLNAYVETYGCTANVVDSEVIKDLLERHGVQIVNSISDADIIIVNTCTVREETDRKICKRLHSLRSPNYDGKRIIVTGCMAAAQPALVSEVLPKASLISPDAIENVTRALYSNSRIIALKAKERKVPIPRYKGGVIYSIAIERGCLGSCSYCIVKRARGDLISAAPHEVVEAVRYAVSRGAKEVRLTGQDIAVYGLDIGLTLPSLLEELLKSVAGNFRIRLGMMNPDTLKLIVDELLDLMSHDGRVYRFFHIPVQSGDDYVLKMMGRNYTASLFKQLVRKIRDRLPDASIATDILVGFPGESECAFQKSVLLIKEVSPDKVHVARYAPRPHTVAAKFEQIPENVKKARSSYIINVSQGALLQRNIGFVNRTSQVLVTELRAGGIIGRMNNYKPVVITNGRSELLGREITVKITEARPAYLKAIPTSAHRG